MIFNEMQIWSNDERPVCFSVLDGEGREMASVNGLWREIVPLEFEPNSSHPRAGRSQHSLVGDLAPEAVEEVTDYAAFTSTTVGYRFQFAGRTFEGEALASVTGSHVKLECREQPSLAMRRAS
jgi:hypothetical protein